MPLLEPNESFTSIFIDQVKDVVADGVFTAAFNGGLSVPGVLVKLVALGVKIAADTHLTESAVKAPGGVEGTGSTYLINHNADNTLITLRYRFDKEGVAVSHGLLWRRESYLTYARIQDIHVSRNIFERWLGIGEAEPAASARSRRGAATRTPCRRAASRCNAVGAL